MGCPKLLTNLKRMHYNNNAKNQNESWVGNTPVAGLQSVMASLWRMVWLQGGRTKWLLSKQQANSPYNP